MNRLKILIIEDDPAQQEVLKGFLEQTGYKVWSASSGEEGLKIAESHDPELIITDFRLGGISGFDVLRKVKMINPETQVIVVTAYGTIEDAVAAMKFGAWDYIAKPIDLDELEIKLGKVARHTELVRENQALKLALREIPADLEIIAESSEMKEVLALVSRIADSEASIFIHGESGTGKEMVARAIHAASPRKNHPFIAVNCAAIPETLFESELFGHEKGAFTGANVLQKGRFELAHRGTLFLDEIGDLPTPVQIKLLRVLQDGEFQRLGSSRVLTSDVRIISATNQPIAELIKTGRFREDLYYRLNVIPIEIPPLRERKSDIPPLAKHFIRKHALKNRRQVTGITPEALNKLMKYNYPGNVRELQNIMERAVILSRTEYITEEDLPLPDSIWENEPANENLSLNKQVEYLEKKLISKALRESGNIQTAAAEKLGISERTLRYKMQKYRLDRKSD